jgi:formylglycine-generating enzyme required for sulfatase activity
MAKYPVTRGEFRKFIEESGYQAKDSCYVNHDVDGHSIYEETAGYSWRNTGYEQTDEHPVVCVDWDDAVAYANWLTKKTGHTYALPSEAQYEYAARGGTKTLYYWADKRDETACQYANLPDLDQADAMGQVPTTAEYRYPCHDGYGYTSPVGKFKPNAFGLYDILGNVWEWVADCWVPNYDGAPTDGSAWMCGDCDVHGTRGGSYGNIPFFGHAGARALKASEYRGHSFGFRVVRLQ